MFSASSILFNRGKRKGFLIFLIAIIFSFFLFFSSCSSSKMNRVLEKNELFSLEYGNFEEQVNLFDLASVGEINTSLAMRDGFFYIANGQSKKIMEFNSYGDLLSLYYNEETNPEPSFFKSSLSPSSTRKALAYPFNEISAIAVDSRKNLYVVDKFTPDRQETDSESNTILSQMVLRFDSMGNFIDYLGQEGPGGTPFPVIDNIYATDNNEIVVVCRNASSTLVYWFSTEGYLLWTVPISKEHVPNPLASEGDDIWVDLGNVIPDYSQHKLYISVNYYSSYIDEASKVESGIDYERTLLFPLNVEDGSYGQALTIPPYTEEVSEGFSSESFSIPYDFIGLTDTGCFFFMLSNDMGFSIQMVQPDGQRIVKRNLRIDHSKTLFYTFSLSNGGILSVFLAQNDKAYIDWWRTDSLIQSVIQN